MSVFHGSCLCQAVRFQVTPPTLFCSHCHCRYCRTAHGAGYVTWLGVAEQQLAFTAGADLVTWYASSQQSRRGFCSRCGSTMFFASTLDPGEIHIARALIDGQVDREPAVHVFIDHKVPWIDVSDELRQLDSSHPALVKYQQVRAPGEAEE